MLKSRKARRRLLQRWRPVRMSRIRQVRERPAHRTRAAHMARARLVRRIKTPQSLRNKIRVLWVLNKIGVQLVHNRLRIRAHGMKAPAAPATRAVPEVRIYCNKLKIQPAKL